MAISALMVGPLTAAYTMHSPQLQSAHSSGRCAVRMASPLVDDIWSTSKGTRVEGNTLKTWDIGDEAIPRVELALRSPGRPIHANIELWHTPAYTPTHFKIYTEDGKLRPINAVIETPKHPKTVAVFNTGPGDFPFEANVANTGLAKAAYSLADFEPTQIQGQALRSYALESDVESVQVLLNSDKLGERNMKAKIELTQGPNQVKQIFEVYASAGYKNPFYAVIHTPGSGNVLRVLNQNTLEFPFDCWVVPSKVAASEPVKMVGAF